MIELKNKNYKWILPCSTTMVTRFRWVWSRRDLGRSSEMRQSSLRNLLSLLSNRSNFHWQTSSHLAFYYVLLCYTRRGVKVKRWTLHDPNRFDLELTPIEFIWEFSENGLMLKDKIEFLSWEDNLWSTMNIYSVNGRCLGGLNVATCRVGLMR